MKKKKIKKESLMQSVLALIISQIMIKILGLAYKLYLTNREGFGDKGNAICGSGFQIYALLLTLSSVGIPNAISKLISERVAIGDNKGSYRIFKIAFITFGLIGFVSSCVLFFGANYISTHLLQIPEAELTLVALSPSIFFVTISCVIKGYFNGRANLKVTANAQTLEQIFKTVLSILLVEIIAITSGTDTSMMAAGANLSTTLATAVCFTYFFKYYRERKTEIGSEIKRSVNYKQTRVRKTIKSILSVSIPMSLGAFLGTINKNIDSMTVVRGLKKYLTEDEAKTQFGILTGKVDTLVTLPMSLNMALTTALIPVISSAKAKGDFETIKKKISFSLLVTILIGLPCSVGMVIYAEPILKLLFPNATAGTLIYQISSVGIIFIVLEQTISGILHGIGKVMVPAIALTVGVIVKFILNIILIPISPQKFILGGTAGAAFSTVACHVISLIIQFKVLRKNINFNLKISKYIIKPILATSIMSIVSYTFFNIIKVQSVKVATILAIIISVITYVICVFTFKIFSKDEIRIIPYGNKIYNILYIEKE